MKLNTLLLIVLIGLAAMNLTRAQEATPEPSEGIRVCTDEEFQEINEAITFNAQLLDSHIRFRNKENIADTANMIAISQSTYWYAIDNLPVCADLFTRGYTLGRVIDNFAIGFGLLNASLVDKAVRNDAESSENIQNRGERFISIYAKTIAEEKLPEVYDIIFVDN